MGVRMGHGRGWFGKPKAMDFLELESVVNSMFYELDEERNSRTANQPYILLLCLLWCHTSLIDVDKDDE